MKNIRQKVALIILVVSVICLLITSLVVSRVARRELLREYRADKEATVSTLKSSLISLLEHYDYNEIEVLLRSKLARPSLTYAAVFDHKGNLVRSVLKKGYSHQELEIVKSQIMIGGETLGMVEIGFSQRHIAGKVRNLMAALSSFLLGFFILMAVTFNVALYRFVVRPLEEFTRTLDEAGPEEMSVRLEYAGRDEFKTLADSFNRLAENLHAAHDKLNKLYTDLKAVDQMKTEFLSVISHELRTPLTPIKTYLSLIRGESFGTLPEEYVKAVKVIERQTDHLLELIDSILDVTRLERGISLELKKEPVSVEVMLKGLKEVSLPQLVAKKIELVLALPLEFPTIMADHVKLHRLFTNLLGNAIKFTPEGGSIKIFGAREEGVVRLTVADNGIGIDKNNLDKIFEKFYQVDSSFTREAGGVGLGLAIAKEIVKAHGGRIWAESEGAGKGTRICLTLPIAG